MKGLPPVLALAPHKRAAPTPNPHALPAPRRTLQGSILLGASSAGLMWGYYRIGPKRRYKARLRDMRSLRCAARALLGSTGAPPLPLEEAGPHGVRAP